MSREPGSQGAAPGRKGFYFPQPGQGLETQDERRPEDVGLDAPIVARLSRFVRDNPVASKRASPRWALWRHGYLVHVEGDFDQTVDVASLRKTWHTMTVGAAIKQGKIPSYHQKISAWQTDLEGNDAEATWWHVITQSAGFDYPYGDYPEYKPGEMWTYSDWNPVHLCHALAKVYGKKGFRDDYDDVIREAYFDAIGMEGWSTRIVFDRSSQMEDGIRFVISLEHMGRLGLLALARGTWNGVELIPRWFVEELETKQTYGMRVNYDGPTDGKVSLSQYPGRFSECPYGYLTWVNTDGDYFPGASPAWAWGKGAGGTIVLWNRENGVVFAGVGVDIKPSSNSIPHIIEGCIAQANPLVVTEDIGSVGQWARFEAAVENTTRYANPGADVELRVTYTKPNGSTVDFWGFHDGDTTWKIRFMPDRLGTWRYKATFSDGSPGIEGSFECVASTIPGMLSKDESNPMWFGFKGGKHVLVRALHVGDRFFAANWPSDKRRAFLDWAQAQGYNMLSIAGHYLNRDAEGRGKGWNTPKLWPLNAAEYRRLESVLDELAKRRILVYPFAGFFGQRSDYPKNPSDQEQYIRYTLARLGPYWNVLFNVAGPEPSVGNSWMSSADVVRLGKKIKELDVFGHPLSVHNRTGDDPYKDSPWSSYGILQGPKTTDRAGLSDGLLRNHPASKPLFAQETLWSGNKNHPDYSDSDIRKNAYVINMSAVALCFGDMNGDSSSGFGGSMALSERSQKRHDIVKRVWDFFEAIPFHRMKPRQDLIDNGYCLADVGHEYVVYLESPGTVNVSIADGTYAVEWINAQDTDDRRSGGATTTGSDLASPTDGDDWIALLKRKRH